MQLAAFNDLPEASAREHMLACCHSKSWAALVAKARPYASLGDLVRKAGEFWEGMVEADILEAFGGHARIGDMEKLRDRFSRAHAEQGQVAKADEKVLQDLLRLNLEYEKRHGFIFIVCATGKSAEEMLGILRGRLPNSREQELRNGAAEQAAITAIRLRNLFTVENSAA